MEQPQFDYKSTFDEQSNDTTLKLYNEVFIFAFPLVTFFLGYFIVIDNNNEIITLLAFLLVGLLIFKLGRNSLFLKKNQLLIHQTLVILLSLTSLIWFVFHPTINAVLLVLIVGANSCYLLFERQITILFFIVYHLTLLLLATRFDIFEYRYIAYSLIYSSASFVVTRWLSTLINSGKEMQISENKYRILFEHGNSAILILKPVNKKFLIVDTNARAEDVFGFSRNELLSQYFGELSIETTEKKSRIGEQILQLNILERIDFDCNFKTKNKRIFEAEVSFVRLNLSEGAVYQVLINDVSSKTQHALELSEMAQSFKNIVDNSQASTFIFTKNKLVYKNPKADELAGEFLNKDSEDIFEIFPSKQKFLLRELLAEASQKVSSYTEIDLGEPGYEKRFSISLVKVIYKGESSILLILTDITLQNEYSIQKIRAEIAEETNKKLSEEIKRHRATQIDLQENTSKLNALFESSKNLFVLTIDRDLAISTFNQSFKTMMKDYLDVDLNVGDDFLNTVPIHEDTYSELIKDFKSSLRGESVNIIIHFPTKKGEVWLECFISPVKVENEPIKEIAFIAHNITEKLENERKVLDSEANNRATVSAIPDMLFKVSKDGYFTDFRLNEDGEKILKNFAVTTELIGEHVLQVFKDKRIARSFLYNIKKAIGTGTVHTQNFIIPFIIGKTDKKMVFENRYSSVDDSEVIVLTRDVTDKVEFETRLIESVKEKEILLKEVHHRVKNNLQVISSILNLQSSYVEDEKTLEIINESQNRIRSMSYIHESLYQTKDFASINFHDYITNLVQNLVHSYQLYSGKTKLNLDIDQVELVLDQAIPCGLILNELVSNSLKYAYPEGESGEIQIEIKEMDGKVQIRVEDFGVGLPVGFKIEESDSLGLGLVDTLVDQIDGELILKTEKGTKYLIIFEKQEL